MMIQTLTCKNINDALLSYANANNYNVKECDFTLLGLSAYLKTVHLENFTKLDATYKKEYTQREKIINDHVRFQEVYKIGLFKKEKSTLVLHYNLIYNTYKTTCDLELLPSSIIPYKEYKASKLYKLLLEEIHRIKAKENILISLFSQTLNDEVKKIVKKIYTQQITEATRIRLCKTFKPKLSQEAKLIRHFENNKQENQQYKEVEADELLIEYIKPIFGEAGLDVMGKRIANNQKATTTLIDFKYDKRSISFKETTKKATYLSLKKGYVKFENAFLSVENTIELHTFTRNQSTLTHDEKNDVEIIIAQDNSALDTVSEGAELKSESVHIRGYVGKNAKVEAKELIIDGATHNGSNIFCKNAKIHRHKGFLRCSVADINLLEGGEIHGTSIHITSALGGSIYAQNIHITQLRSNVKLFASSSITIDSINGEDNSFTINYKKVPILMKRLEFIKEDIDLLKYSHEKAKQHDEIRAKSIQSKINSFKDDVKEIENSVLNATITLKGFINGVNKITFATANGDICYSTTQPKYEPFHLSTTDETITLLPVNISLKK